MKRYVLDIGKTASLEMTLQRYAGETAVNDKSKRLSNTNGANTMAKVSEIQSYQSPWLRAEDLQGSARRVRIERASVETIKQADGSNQERVVVAFTGKAKKLICNKTQVTALAAICGDDTDQWRGREVFLSPQPTPQGKLTIAVMAAEATQAEAVPF
ncbi:MAG: hypothetical protein U0350_40710 [Caldilineaceae bacterium]